MNSEEALDLVRAICMGLPEVEERPSHGAPTFFVQGKKTFCMFLDNHHNDGRLSIWCAAPEGEQEALVSEGVDWYFRPPYVGHRGWLGILLNRDLEEERLREILAAAYCRVAPPALAALVNI